MIKVEVIEKFTLERFAEIKNLKRKREGKDKELNIGDTFECTEDLVKYLTGDNAYKKVVVKIIEIKQEEKEIKEEKPKKKKTSKK